MENDQSEEPEVITPENEGLQDVTDKPIQQQGLGRSTFERRPPETWNLDYVLTCGHVC